MSSVPNPRVHRITVPCSADLVATVRMFLAAVGTVAGVPDDVLDDLKLAGSELATAIVEHDVASVIEVVATIEPPHLIVRVVPWPETITTTAFGGLDIVAVLFPGTQAGEGAVTVPVDLADHG